MHKRSDIARLFLRHSLPMIIVVLIFAFSVIAMIDGFVSRSNFDQASQTLSQAAVYYDSILEEISALNLVFSTNNDAIRALRTITDMNADYNTYKEIRLLTSFLTATASSQRYIEGIFIFLSDRDDFLVTDAGLVSLETYEDGEWFLAYNADPYGSTHTEVVNDGVAIRISQPIVDTVGDYAGVIAIDLDARHIRNDFLSYFSYEDMYLTVRNAEGVVLFTTAPDDTEHLAHFSLTSDTYGWIFDLYIDKNELYNLSRTIIYLTTGLSIALIVIGLFVSYRMNKEEQDFMNILVERLSGKDSMNIAFQWLLSAQDAKVLSSPNILLSRNEVSRIVTGEEIPIQEANSTGNTLSLSTKFKSVGVTLEVEPSMINRDNVTLRIFPKVSNVVRYENVSAGGDTTYPVPVISARSVETHLRMQDKQVVMMGGLYNSRDTLQQQRIPVLSDLPLIGELFTGKNESKEVTQLIFFLKIHIISPDQAASGIFYNFDRTGKISEKLGEIVENADSIPLHRTSVENFGEELNHAKPGELERRRREFHQTPITIDEPAETTTSGAETK